MAICDNQVSFGHLAQKWMVLYGWHQLEAKYWVHSTSTSTASSHVFVCYIFFVLKKTQAETITHRLPQFGEGWTTERTIWQLTALFRRSYEEQIKQFFVANGIDDGTKKRPILLQRLSQLHPRRSVSWCIPLTLRASSNYRRQIYRNIGIQGTKI